MSVVMGVSQPFAAARSQLSKPAWQAPRPHVPDEQTDAALGNEQTWPHAPQFAGSVALPTSQPSLRLLLQSANPAPQALIAQAPLTQATVALGAIPQAVPQAPQFITSLAVAASQPFSTI